MRLHHIRQWHWVTVGALTGLLIGGGRTAWGPAYRSSTARTLSQSLFERATLAPPGTTPRISELVVHPPDVTGGYWVTGRYDEPSGRQQGSAGPAVRSDEFKFRAPTPYRPKFAVDSADPDHFTVADYLDQVAARVPQAGLSYRYAWEDQPGLGLAAWLGGATFLIGVVWPALLRRLPGAGLPDESTGANLCAAPRMAPSPVAVLAKASNLDASLDTALDAYIASLDSTVIIPPGSNATLEGGDEASVTAPAVRLAAVPTEPEGTPAPMPPNDYAGEFYPTAAHGGEQRAKQPQRA